MAAASRSGSRAATTVMPTMPAVRIGAVVTIESVRGLPLLSILFVASIMLPLFLPGRMTVDGLLRAPGGPGPERDLFFHFPHYYPTTTPVSAVRSGSWKLLEYLEDGRTELYDLREDLVEARDVAAQAPDVARRLKARLEEWRRRVGARMPRLNPDYK